MEEAVACFTRAHLSTEELARLRLLTTSPRPDLEISTALASQRLLETDMETSSSLAVTVTLPTTNFSPFVETYTLGTFPAEIREMIFRDVRGEDLQGQQYLCHLAIAVCGDKMLVSEVTSIIYNSVHLLIRPDNMGNMWIHGHFPPAVVANAKTLEVRFPEVSENNYAFNTRPWGRTPFGLECATNVNHILVDLAGEYIYDGSLSVALNDWSANVGGIKKFSIKVDPDVTCRLWNIKYLNKALRLQGDGVGERDDPHWYTWLAADSSVLVFAQPFIIWK